MLPKFFNNRLVLNGPRPAVAHKAQVEQVHVAFILRVLYSYRISNYFVSQCISKIIFHFSYCTDIW